MLFKIVILENYSLFCTGIRVILEQGNEFEIAGEARDIDELMHHAEHVIPDVIILDLLHCNNAGLEALRKIKRAFPGVPVLLITSFELSDCFSEHISLGVKGFIFSNSTPAELLKAVRKLCRGGEYFPNTVHKIYIEAIELYEAGRKALLRRRALTDRESAVLRCISLGLSHKEIGEKLYISPRTVETHKRNILAKLNLKSTAELIKYAIHHQVTK